MRTLLRDLQDFRRSKRERFIEVLRALVDVCVCEIVRMSSAVRFRSQPLLSRQAACLRASVSLNHSLFLHAHACSLSCASCMRIQTKIVPGVQTVKLNNIAAMELQSIRGMYACVCVHTHACLCMPSNSK